MSTTKQRDVALLVALRAAASGGESLPRATGKIIELLFDPGPSPTLAEEPHLAILRAAVAGAPQEKDDEEAD